MHIFNLEEILGEQTLRELHQWLSICQWYRNVPGGFVTNFPNRLVNAYGNGAGVNGCGELTSKGWAKTYWTAKMNQSNITLGTPTEALPTQLRNIIPNIRTLFQQVFPDAKLTNHTFNIAVCNYYNDPDMTICAHTDDNPWYPIEDTVGPVFASLTFYPDGEPSMDRAFARFQIKQDGRWISIKLPHNSVMIMPSNIEHRVQAHTKKLKPYFKPRINITLRSTYPLDVNPLMNAMATSNHCRYYKLPKTIYIPTDLSKETSDIIVDSYNKLLANYNKKKLIVIKMDTMDNLKQKKKEYTSTYKSMCRCEGFGDYRGSANIVYRTLKMVIDYANEMRLVRSHGST